MNGMSRFVVMGVSGCGKSSIGAGFAAARGLPFTDGDHLHPPANIAKMSRGEALNDDDRAPWLDLVGAELAGGNRVIACSALKRKYRDQIRNRAGAPVMFLLLQGARETLLARMSSRPGHFMPTSLLDSQLATLEPLLADELHLIQNIDQTPAEIIAGFQRSVI
jgi:gluconokinase